MFMTRPKKVMTGLIWRHKQDSFDLSVSTCGVRIVCCIYIAAALHKSAFWQRSGCLDLFGCLTFGCLIWEVMIVFDIAASYTGAGDGL